MPDDGVVEELVARAEQLLGRLEEVPGPAGELAAAAVTALTELYGEALGRVVGHAAGTPVLRALTDDALVGHLLALHGVHPDPVERRVSRALDGLRLELSSLGRDVTLAGLSDGVAEVALGGHGGGCGSPSAEQLTELVRDVVGGAAPELVEVRVVAERATTFVPLDSLLRAGAR
jgi:Fe-S cluster biogenesis protein NfuA